MSITDEVKNKENLIIQKTIIPFLKENGFIKAKRLPWEKHSYWKNLGFFIAEVQIIKRNEKTGRFFCVETSIYTDNSLWLLDSSGTYDHYYISKERTTVWTMIEENTDAEELVSWLSAELPNIMIFVEKYKDAEKMIDEILKRSYHPIAHGLLLKDTHRKAQYKEWLKNEHKKLLQEHDPAITIVSWYETQLQAVIHSEEILKWKKESCEIVRREYERFKAFEKQIREKKLKTVEFDRLKDFLKLSVRVKLHIFNYNDMNCGLKKDSAEIFWNERKKSTDSEIVETLWNECKKSTDSKITETLWNEWRKLMDSQIED